MICLNVFDTPCVQEQSGSGSTRCVTWAAESRQQLGTSMHILHVRRDAHVARSTADSSDSLTVVIPCSAGISI